MNSKINTSGSGIRLFGDIRRMRRNIQMRLKTNPEEVGEMIDLMLAEAIALRATDGGVLGKGAIKELKQVRKDILAGQITTGGQGSDYITKISLVLDQIEGIEQESKKQESEQKRSQGRGVIRGTMGAIGRAIPSADTLISALITANPVLGYSAKVGRDLIGSVFGGRGSGNQIRSQESQRIAELLQEKENLEQELDRTSTSSQERSEEVEQKTLEKLDEIRQELRELNSIWLTDLEGNTVNDVIHNALNDLDETLGDNAEGLERLIHVSQLQTDTLERIEDLEHQSLSEERKKSSLERLRSREQDYLGNKSLRDSFKESGLIDGKGKGGLFSNVASRTLGISTGIGAMIGSLTSGIIGVLGTIVGWMTPLAVTLGKIAGIGLLVVSVVNSVFGMFKGFANAAEILGIDEEELEFMDLMKAGFAGLISGLLSPINWILDFFGLGFAEDEEELRDNIIAFYPKIAEFFTNLVENITDMFSIEFLQETVWPLIKDLLFNPFAQFKLLAKSLDSVFGTDLEELVDDMTEGIKDWFLEFLSNVKDSIFGAVDSVWEGIKSALPSWLGGDEDDSEGSNESSEGLISKGLKWLGFSSDENEKAAQEQMQFLETSDIPHTHALREGSMLIGDAEMEYARMINSNVSNQQGSTVIAPSSMSIQNNNLTTSSGARNNDVTLGRLRLRQYGH